MPRPPVTPGTYRHFKGNLYEVIGTAQLVDSSEVFVIYRPLYGTRELVARPVEEFTGTVLRDGAERKRFTLVDPHAVLSDADACLGDSPLK